MSENQLMPQLDEEEEEEKEEAYRMNRVFGEWTLKSELNFSQSYLANECHVAVLPCLCCYAVHLIYFFCFFFLNTKEGGVQLELKWRFILEVNISAIIRFTLTQKLDSVLDR